MLAFPPDVTFIVQLVSFFVLLFVLNRLLFAPFGEVIAERTRRTHGARERAAEIQVETDNLTRAVKQGLDDARGIALEQAEAIRREARDGAVEILNAAKEDAAARLSHLRGAIALERDRAAKALGDDAAGLAQAMVEAVLKPRNPSVGR
jgi:F-type H+-transporting ATPase subunit b